MNKKNGFISRYRLKALAALMVGGMVAYANSGSVEEPTVTYANEYAVRENDVFAESLPSPQADEASEASNVVFVSRVYDPDNPAEKDRHPASGIIYEVFTESGKLVSRGQTDADGRFVVKNLPDGHYKWIHVSLPEQYVPMVDYNYFSKFTSGEDMEIYGYATLVQSEDFPYYDSDGNIIDDEGNRLDEDGNVIPEVNTPPEPEIEPDEESSSENPPRDEQGNIIGDDGNLYDEVGNRVNEEGHFIDEDGRLINSNGHLVDGSGNRVDESGHLVDEDGLRVDKDGYLVDVDKEELLVNNDASVSSDDTNVVEAKSQSDNLVVENVKDNTDDLTEEHTEKSTDGQVNPDDVQTYDKGITGFVLLALAGMGGLLVLNRQRINS